MQTVPASGAPPLAAPTDRPLTALLFRKLMPLLVLS